MIIAVDAVGGDHYPSSTVGGAVMAVHQQPELRVILTGPRESILPELKKHDFDEEQISVYHAPEIISMSEEPARAVKVKRNSSVVAALNLQKEGECDAFISAGNTGALMAASTLILGKLDGVSRPTIAAIYPTIKGPRLLLDAGANLIMREEMYLQFAVMGCIYAEKVMGIRHPKVGLLNVGEEDEKGSRELKAAFSSLRAIPDFIGNVEGHDILTGKADVFICNGLVGNLILKLGESIPHTVQKLVDSTIGQMELSSEQKDLIFTVLNKSLHKFDPDTVGGVPFLGINGVSMVGHGRSTSTAVKNMIFNAVKCVEHNLNGEITNSLRQRTF
jgi:glycerol-3-phosphate acyltransferase PlsX